MGVVLLKISMRPSRGIVLEMGRASSVVSVGVGVVLRGTHR